MAKIAQTHVERFKQLQREVARKLKRHASDLHVQHVATLHLMREGVQARLLSGHYVEPSEVLKLDEALARYMPAADAALTVELEIVQSVKGLGHCPHCHRDYEVEDYIAPKPKEPPQTIDVVAEPVRAEPKALPQPVESKPEPPRRETVADWAPPRVDYSAISPINGSASGWPDFSASHPLPPVPVEGKR